MEELLLKIGEFFNSEILIANVGVISMAIVWLVKAFIDVAKSRKVVKVEVDNKETNDKLEKLEKDHEMLKKEHKETQDLLMLMIRHSRLSDEAKVKAEDIYDGKEVNTEVVEVNFESNEPTSTVVEKLTKELNK